MTTGYVIRPASPADAQAIAAHRYPDEADSAERPVYADWVRGALERGNYIGLMTLDVGQIVAGAGLLLLDWGPGRGDPNPMRARLVNVWTHQEYRRRGLARQLVQMLLAEAKARGVGVVSLSSTEMGRPLYEGLGFEAYLHEMLLRLNDL